MSLPHPAISSWAAAAVAALLALPAPAAARIEDDLARARGLLLTGRYREAREAYERLTQQGPLAAAIGVARCQRAVGERDGALRSLRAAAGANPTAAAPRAELAQLEFERGDYAAAQGLVDSALALDPDQPGARYLGGELHRVAGRLEQANEAYRWCVRYYNREQEAIRDPETLRWIGLAAAQYARWNRNSGQFHFLVNTLYPDALKRDSLYWPAHLEAALLFIEKFNRPDAMDELDSALAINPRAAEAHAARALIALQQFELDSARAAIDRALAINPSLLVARRLLADARMVTSGPREAIPILEQALGLDPVDEQTLGRLAAAHGATEGLRDDPAGTRMGVVIAEAVRRNPHCGEFFAALAASLDLLQKYPSAAHYYEEARRRMPQLVGVPGQLGLVYMRLADETRARAVLKEAFEIDPFNVRVKNSLEALELLEGYAALETPHFLIRFDRSRDSLLARYASRHLEDRVYPEVVKTLGYAPRGKSLMEIFSRAKGSSGHAWFSARMVGLPFLGTVAACAGKMVAMTSPNDGTRFNWARVLRHEFVHLVNLQQTDFNISRWYTEALAVRNEGPGRPRVWDQVLRRRAAADSLFRLDTINLGFVRPSSGEDWALAYYQAELYARYVADAYGGEGLNKLIAAYADNLDTSEGLRRCFGVTREAFEKGYRAYVDRIAGGGGAGAAAPRRAPEDPAALERAAEAEPRNADVLARLSRAYLDRGLTTQARETAERALAIDPRSQPAAFVLARARVTEGAKAQALEALRSAFDPRAPHLDALVLYANLALETPDHAEAERLALLGQERFPYAADWERGLARVYRETGERDKLAQALERGAAFDPDDFGTRMELARLAADRKDPEAAGRWAEEAIGIDVTNATAHATLAEGLAGSGHAERAIEEYEVASGLDPAKLEWRLALAKACVAAGKKDRARLSLEELLRRDASQTEARELLNTLGR